MDLNNSQTTESGQGQLLSKLPTELLLLIVALVEEKNDLLALCGASTIIRAISLPLFFRAVKLVDPARQERLMESLRDPQRARLVTEFRAEIYSLMPCHPLHGDLSCSPCNSLDEIVGEALIEMIKLESLLLECRLCPGTLAGRHTYIDKLPTRSLRTFQFDCRCSRKFSTDQQKMAATLPYLASVQSFSYQHYIPNQGIPILEDPNILPLVRNMKYHGTSQDDWILTTRPIERLHSRGGLHKRIARGLNQSQGKLTHLRVNIFLVLVLVEVPMTCGHLQHIGSFRSRKGADLISSQLSSCPPMENVTSMDVTMHSTHTWNEEACRKVKRVLPSLNKVLLHTGMFAVWELQGPTWKMRTVDEFTPWDIIRGACDDL